MKNNRRVKITMDRAAGAVRLLHKITPERKTIDMNRFGKGMVEVLVAKCPRCGVVEMWAIEKGEEGDYIDLANPLYRQYDHEECLAYC